MRNNAIGLIGCGNMGGAIVRGMVRKGISSPQNIFLYDKEEARTMALAKDTGCMTGELSRMVRGCSILIIAVKPQNSAEVFGQISPDIVDQTILSVMAGVTIGSMVKQLGDGASVVRSMPNMGAFVGEGMTCVSFGPGKPDRRVVLGILSSVGEVVEVEESAMDAVTALSGSGPAYFFCLAAAMVKAGVSEGLEKSVANKLVERTMKGAGVLLSESEHSPEVLSDMVASRGGTTEAALKVFAKQGLEEIIIQAVSAARKRSEELSSG